MALTKATFSMLNGASFNVLDYGADATGATDTTTAIQAAITAANAAGGGTIVFPKGTYLVGTTTSLTLQSNISLLGEGSASIIKLANNSSISASSALFTATSKTGISVRNLYFNGNRANQTVLVGLFRVQTSSYVSFQNCTFVNCNNVCIYFTNASTFCSVTNCVLIDSNGTNVKFGTDCTDAIVANNLMYDTGTYASHSDGFVMSRFNTNRRITISNNIFNSPAGSGLTMAIWLLCGVNIEVTGNIFQLSNMNAIQINAESAMTDISITNNQLNSCLIGVTDVTPGFNVTRLNIIGNVIQQTNQTNIAIVPTYAGVFSYVCVNSNVLNGTMDGAAAKAIQINAPYSTISNNSIVMAGTMGGDGISNSAENVVMTGNVINMSALGARGIVSTADYVSAIGNTVIGSTSYGIRMTAPANYCNVTGNTLRSCALGILNGGANSVTANNIS